MSLEEERPAPLGYEPQARLIRRLKWGIVAALAAFEFTFDFWVEPWLRSTVFEESIERYLAFFEVGVVGAIVIGAFSRLERMQRELASRQTDLERLYSEASAWDVQLEGKSVV